MIDWQRPRPARADLRTHQMEISMQHVTHTSVMSDAQYGGSLSLASHRTIDQQGSLLMPSSTCVSSTFLDWQGGLPRTGTLMQPGAGTLDIMDIHLAKERVPSHEHRSGYSHTNKLRVLTRSMSCERRSLIHTVILSVLFWTGRMSRL